MVILLIFPFWYCNLQVWTAEISINRLVMFQTQRKVYTFCFAKPSFMSKEITK